MVVGEGLVLRWRVYGCTLVNRWSTVIELYKGTPGVANARPVITSCEIDVVVMTHFKTPCTFLWQNHAFRAYFRIWFILMSYCFSEPKCNREFKNWWKNTKSPSFGKNVLENLHFETQNQRKTALIKKIPSSFWAKLKIPYIQSVRNDHSNNLYRRDFSFWPKWRRYFFYHWKKSAASTSNFMSKILLFSASPHLQLLGLDSFEA